MSTATVFSALPSSQWEESTTTTTGESSPLHTHGGRTVEPVRVDRAQLRAVLADDRRPVAWPKLYEKPSDVRITSSYVLTLVLTGDVLIEAGDSRETVSPSASLAKMVSVFFSGTPSSSIEPRTALGRRLLELRRRIVAGGAPLLDWNDLEQETRARRGERQ